MSLPSSETTNEQIATFDAVVAPRNGVGSIPMELLQTIFEWATSEDIYDSTCEAVSRVCRQWRLAALGSKKLWKTVALDGTVEGQSKRLAEYADRSNPLLLDVRVVFDRSRHSVREADVYELLSTQSHRIHNITLCIYHWRGWRESLMPSGGGVSLEEFLNLETCAFIRDEHVPKHRYRDDFSFSSLPRSLLALKIQSLRTDFGGLPNYFTRLTRLELAFVSLEDLEMLLYSCVGHTLELLHIHCMDQLESDGWGGFSHQKAILSNLRTLSIILVPLKLVEVLASQFSMPLLERMDYGIGAIRARHEEDERLMLALRELFEKCVQLRVLHVFHGSKSLRHVLRALSWASSRRPAPRLARLTLSYDGQMNLRRNPITFDEYIELYGLLSAAVHSRRLALPRAEPGSFADNLDVIQTITITPPASLSPELPEFLEGLKTIVAPTQVIVRKANAFEGAESEDEEIDDDWREHSYSYKDETASESSESDSEDEYTDIDELLDF